MTRRPAPSFLLIVVTVSAALGVAWAASETTRVMGSIDIAAGEHTGNLQTVNGSIRVGDNAVVGDAHTVNGSIALASHASAAELKTVNGSVRLEQDARVSGDVHTVNGKVSLGSGAEVAGGVRNVNGKIRIAAAHVGGGIDTVTGGIDLGPDARIDGGIHVQKDTNSFHSGAESIPRVVIRSGSVVGGTLNFERPVQLYVSDRATIGPVQGATAIRFSDDHPPESAAPSD
jgi:DUF4097 and DUF4098 domain-containing protein YvlB